MSIIVRKPTDAEIAKMQSQPTWGCGVSEFDWNYNTNCVLKRTDVRKSFYSQNFFNLFRYDSEETALIIEGEVTVTYDGGSAFIEAGDLVVFPQGMSCVWKVTKPLNKHYMFK